MKYKKPVYAVRITVRRVTFDDPAEAATALERWNSSASVMLRLLERYEAQEAPVVVVKDMAGMARMQDWRLNPLDVK